MKSFDNDVDVIIIGAGAAGLSGALMLGRARRRVLVCDGGDPRNAPASHSHSFFTRDGVPPLEMLRIGREQLDAYEGVRVVKGDVSDVVAEEDRFAVTLGDGSRHRARRILLATGVRDELPPIGGLRELWGKSVVHCPYCHGWEVRGEPLALYADGEMAVEFAALLKGWSDDLAICTDGPSTISPEDRARLAANGIAIHEEPIERLEGRDGNLERIVFTGGKSIERRALFIRPPQRQRSALAARLGCEFTDAGHVKVDATMQTTVPGVYAAGDMAMPMQQVVMAAGAGSQAGAAINGALCREEFWG
jgi:thioredoxin reductase